MAAALTARSTLEIVQLTKLLQSVRDDDRKQIEKLATAGIPHLLNYRDKTSGDTALSVAAVSNMDELVSFILELGANPNVVDFRGRTAAMRAAEYGHVETLDKLVAAHANMKIRDVNGRGEWSFNVKCS